MEDVTGLADVVGCQLAQVEVVAWTGFVDDSQVAHSVSVALVEALTELDSTHEPQV